MTVEGNQVGPSQTAGEMGEKIGITKEEVCLLQSRRVIRVKATMTPAKAIREGAFPRR